LANQAAGAALPVFLAQPLNTAPLRSLLCGNTTREADMRILTFVALALAALTGSTAAAEIKVYSTIGMRSVLEALQPKFEQASGHKLDITWGLAAGLTKRVADGETPDALVAIRGGIDGLVKSGRVAEPSAVTLALSGVGVSVRGGAPKPDISTPEKLKEALLAAKAIAYSDPTKGGASGVHFAKVTEQLGILEAVKAKSKYPDTAGLPGKLLLDGTADLAIAQVPELLEVKGTDYVGPLPGNLQNVTMFAAGVVTGAKQPDAAAAFLSFLRTPEAVATIKEKGMDPPGPPAKGS
jgi:molybdate transport system substrate-binding protein